VAIRLDGVLGTVPLTTGVWVKALLGIVTNYWNRRFPQYAQPETATDLEKAHGDGIILPSASWLRKFYSDAMQAVV